MIRNAPFLIALSALSLAACQATTSPDVTSGGPQIATFETAPDTPGLCWANLPGTRVTEIVSETILVQEAQVAADGTEITPAIYRKVTRPRSFNEGDGRWFARVCASDLTPDFIASLQRALAARNGYRGPITGAIDGRTARAIRAYQKAQGLDSATPSLSMAEQLGLAQFGLANG